MTKMLHTNVADNTPDRVVVGLSEVVKKTDSFAVVVVVLLSVVVAVTLGLTVVAVVFRASVVVFSGIKVVLLSEFVAVTLALTVVVVFRASVVALSGGEVTFTDKVVFGCAVVISGLDVVDGRCTQLSSNSKAKFFPF